MAKPKQPSAQDVREIAHKSFLLGVDWVCRSLVDADLLAEEHVELFQKKAQRVLGK